MVLVLVNFPEGLMVLLSVILNVNRYFWRLDPDHDRGANVWLGAVSTFGFRQRFEHFEKPSNFFILWNSLLIDSMKPIMNCQDLI